MIYTPPRLHLIAAMLADPDGEWSVNRMKDLLSAKVDVSAATVQDTFYLLLSECLAEAVPYQHALTIRIRTDSSARRLLANLLKRWREQYLEPPGASEHQSATQLTSQHERGWPPMNRDYYSSQ